jgi:hypothetical protein
MKHHRFFSFTHFDHHNHFLWYLRLSLRVVFAWIWWHARKIFRLYAKIRKRSSDREDRELDENSESRNRELSQNEVCAFLFLDKSLSYDHCWVLFLYRSDYMQENFFLCIKKSENGSLKKRVMNWMMNFHQVLDSRFIIFIKFSIFSIKESFRILSYRWKSFLAIRFIWKCHEMWLLIILRMRKSCINDRTIAKIMIIREEFYSKDVMWSVVTRCDYS